jgi:flagellar hook-associated protein 3 FlgL
MSTTPRISFLGANRTAQLRLRDAFGRLDRANQRVASGKAYSRPSEDTSASSRAATLREQMDQLLSFDRSIDDAKSRLTIADTKMSQAMELYHRAATLATQGASSLNSPESRLAIREEILQLRGELQAVANTTYLGAPIFAGLEDGQAVSFDTGTSSWVFNGNPTDRVQRRVAPSEQVDVSITAQELFTNGTDDMFQVLDDLAASLAADDTPGIQATLDRVAALRSTLSAGQARLGAVTNRVEQAESRNEAIKISLTAELSEVEHVDLADAITDQEQLSVAYQAALGVIAQTSRTTLLDWLR